MILHYIHIFYHMAESFCYLLQESYTHVNHLPLTRPTDIVCDQTVTSPRAKTGGAFYFITSNADCSRTAHVAAYPTVFSACFVLILNENNNYCSRRLSFPSPISLFKVCIGRQYFLFRICQNHNEDPQAAYTGRSSLSNGSIQIF